MISSDKVYKNSVWKVHILLSLFLKVTYLDLEVLNVDRFYVKIVVRNVLVKPLNYLCTLVEKGPVLYYKIRHKLFFLPRYRIVICIWWVTYWIINASVFPFNINAVPVYKFTWIPTNTLFKFFFTDILIYSSIYT